ncbi:hypothetical protein [Olleya sp. R77988]|uniref:hypothetical protein n=1 Tax=Olleya sp. R77988 TaxID=3093875 RepID=UPI0037C9DBA6
MKHLFEEKFNEPIGLKIEYFSFLFSIKENAKEPILAWMKTSDSIWHRFFIDAWMPHWNATNTEESKEYYETEIIEDYIKEELEDYQSEDGDKWEEVNILEAFDLINKKIINAESKHIELNGFWCTQLNIEIENNNEIILNDYCDEKESELIINGIKL